MREKFTHATSAGQLGHWFGPVTGLGLLGPAQPHEPYFFYYFLFVFLYHKIKFGVKIPGFHRNIAKIIYIYMKYCFHAYVQVSQKIIS